MRNPHIGSSFDDFLKGEGIYDEVTAAAIDQVSAWQIDSLDRTLLQAPYDDEPETAEERAAVQEAYDDIATGRLVNHNEARRWLLGDHVADDSSGERGDDEPLAI